MVADILRTHLRRRSRTNLCLYHIHEPRTRGARVDTAGGMAHLLQLLPNQDPASPGQLCGPGVLPSGHGLDPRLSCQLYAADGFREGDENLHMAHAHIHRGHRAQLTQLLFPPSLSLHHPLLGLALHRMPLSSGGLQGTYAYHADMLRFLEKNERCVELLNHTDDTLGDLAL